MSVASTTAGVFQQDEGDAGKRSGPVQVTRKFLLMVKEQLVDKVFLNKVLNRFLLYLVVYLLSTVMLPVVLLVLQLVVLSQNSLVVLRQFLLRSLINTDTTLLDSALVDQSGLKKILQGLKNLKLVSS